MAEVEIRSNIKLGMADLLEGIAKMDTKDIELFLKEVANILSQKKKQPVSKSSQEQLLIKKIKKAYPAKLKKAYRVSRISRTIFRTITYRDAFLNFHY